MAKAAQCEVGGNNSLAFMLCQPKNQRSKNFASSIPGLANIQCI
ncbi:hypothetical protein thalar_00389 [Litoreibacter arenae DSM 19593]|uniref:Uncharacterized protein n=1 Tax=Litoreibacter arenae DSM 19593 TaxID=1123360 RepID=S9S453_9RHOB|nr:hypothetical protein thalar_00389 [Litoreibacter arenae DSM 19593]